MLGFLSQRRRPATTMSIAPTSCGVDATPQCVRGRIKTDLTSTSHRICSGRSFSRTSVSIVACPEPGHSRFRSWRQTITSLGRRLRKSGKRCPMTKAVNHTSKVATASDLIVSGHGFRAGTNWIPISIGCGGWKSYSWDTYTTRWESFCCNVSSITRRFDFIEVYMPKGSMREPLAFDDVRAFQQNYSTPSTMAVDWKMPSCSSHWSLWVTLRRLSSIPNQSSSQ